MQVERIDRENGAGTIISGDEFAAILERREEPEFAEEIYGNVLMGGELSDCRLSVPAVRPGRIRE